MPVPAGAALCVNSHVATLAAELWMGQAGGPGDANLFIYQGLLTQNRVPATALKVSATATTNDARCGVIAAVLAGIIAGCATAAPTVTPTGLQTARPTDIRIVSEPEKESDRELAHATLALAIVTASWRRSLQGYVGSLCAQRKSKVRTCRNTSRPQNKSRRQPNCQQPKQENRQTPQRNQYSAQRASHVQHLSGKLA